MTKRHASLWVLIPALCACLFAVGVGAAHADINQSVWTGQSNNFYYTGPGGDFTAHQNLGAGYAGTVTDIGVVTMTSNTLVGATLDASLTCYTDDFYLTSCGQSATSTVTTFLNGGDTWATTTLASGFTLDPSRTYRLNVHIHANSILAFVYLFGTNLPVWFGGAASPGDAGTQGTVSAIAFNLSGNGFFGPTSGASFGSVSTSSATSSSLFSGSASSTLALISAQCSGSGNLFSEALCLTFSYLFVPDPTILNSFATLPTHVSSRFPFSWVSGVQTSIAALSATTSTTTMVSLAYNYHDLGIGSTTPMGNILPNITVFSRATIETYISPTLWDTFQTLIALAIWLAFGYDVFFTVRNHMAGSSDL